MSAAACSARRHHGSPEVCAEWTRFSWVVFMCRDPDDSANKVSCCVETSYCFKNRDFDAVVKVPAALPLKMSLSRKRKHSKSNSQTHNVGNFSELLHINITDTFALSHTTDVLFCCEDVCECVFSLCWLLHMWLIFSHTCDAPTMIHPDGKGVKSSGPLIGPSWCLLRPVAMTTRHRSFTAWRQNESVHLVQEEEEARRRGTQDGGAVCSSWCRWSGEFKLWLIFNSLQCLFRNINLLWCSIFDTLHFFRIILLCSQFIGL